MTYCHRADQRPGQRRILLPPVQGFPGEGSPRGAVGAAGEAGRGGGGIAGQGQGCARRGQTRWSTGGTADQLEQKEMTADVFFSCVRGSGLRQMDLLGELKYVQMRASPGETADRSRSRPANGVTLLGFSPFSGSEGLSSATPPALPDSIGGLVAKWGLRSWHDRCGHQQRVPRGFLFFFCIAVQGFDSPLL